MRRLASIVGGRRKFYILLIMRKINAVNWVATLLCAWLLASCSAPRIAVRENRLNIPRGTVTIDAAAEDWGDARLLSTLTSAHDRTTRDGTRVALCYDDEKLYFLFEVADSDLVMEAVENERRIGGQDRVELFFSSDRKMSFYCGAEMAEAGVLDHGGTFYRKSSMDWNFKTLQYEIERTEEGYLAEGSFDLAELRELNLIGRNGRIYLGIFRGDKPADGGRFRWFSWVVSERQERPDFHHPYAQGVAYLR